MFKIHVRIICKDGTTFHICDDEKFDNDQYAQDAAKLALERFRSIIGNEDLTAFSFKDRDGVRWVLFEEDLKTLRLSVTIEKCDESKV